VGGCCRTWVVVVVRGRSLLLTYVGGRPLLCRCRGLSSWPLVVGCHVTDGGDVAPDSGISRVRGRGDGLYIRWMETMMNDD